MEDILFLIFCILSIINIQIKGKNNFNKDYMALENTSSIRGIFVWLIFMSHNNSYYKNNKKYIYKIILHCFGQKMVSLFLFYSGFGIYESITKKGFIYVKNLPIKSLILFIKFQLILLIFVFNNILLGIKFNFKKYLLSTIFKRNIGNSNWFAFTIICLYFYSYLSFRFIKSKKLVIVGVFFINIICYFHFLFIYNINFNLLSRRI